MVTNANLRHENDKLYYPYLPKYNHISIRLMSK